MRHQTETEGEVMYTTVHLDCGHAVKYQGVPDERRAKLLPLGVVVSRTGTSRCKDCQAEYGQRLFEALKTQVVR